MPYNAQAAVAYAHQWAYRRNPAYLDFSNIGGDCTNFVSQCLHAGGCPMNYSKSFGWYYNTPNDRAPAWTGVSFFYDFLMHNSGIGPYGREVPMEQIRIGDVIQLAFQPDDFTHACIVVDLASPVQMSNILVAAHTIDSDYRPLDSYTRAVQWRYLQIDSR